MNKFPVLAALMAGVLAVPAATAADQGASLPRANAAWVYDVSNTPGVERRYDPGYFATALNRYNEQAGGQHKIQVIYTYAGSLEMYCPGKRAERCQPDDLVVIYPPGKGDSRLGGSDDVETVAAYQQALDPERAGGRVSVVPVIDGVVNADYAGSMRGFNELPPAMARSFADAVARKVCADPAVAGVQFDIEPFNVESKNGQYHFYKRIAENFAGSVPASSGKPEVACRRNAYPQGRFFSVFTSSWHLKPQSPGAPLLREIMTAHGNGYVIAALYDLGEGPPGRPLAVSDYEKRAMRHARQTADWAEQLQIPYQLGIPAAATAHEHAFCLGSNCERGLGAEERTQEGYTSASLAAVERSGARDSAYFRGIAVWGWTRGIHFGEIKLEPQAPTVNVLALLAKRL